MKNAENLVAKAIQADAKLSFSTDGENGPYAVLKDCGFTVTEELIERFKNLLGAERYEVDYPEEGQADVWYFFEEGSE